MKSSAVLEVYTLFTFIQNIIAQTDPIITAWRKTTGTGYKGILANVDVIKYSNDFVYVHTSGIPSYSIGPWTGNPNDAKNKNYTFKFSRKPSDATTKTRTSLGHFGLWINGVGMFNPDDAQSFNNKGVWNRNAFYWEGSSFDNCQGHPENSGEYHHHVNPTCLYSYSDSSNHSPIIGFTFDSFPVYGPFGYSDPKNSNSPIKRIMTSYRLRNITVRQTLSDGTCLTSSNYGPEISANYPLGCFIQDYEFVEGLGDLDVYNGRWTVTPDYPNGTYAYFIATTVKGENTYPYVTGPYYFGDISKVMANIGPNSGKVGISETVTTYFSYTSSSPLAKTSIILPVLSLALVFVLLL